MTQQFIIEIDDEQGVPYEYNGDLFSLGNRLTELKARKLIIPNNIPKYSFGLIKKACQTMKHLTIELSNDLSWVKGSVGNSGSYSDKYKTILLDSFVETDEFDELMDKVNEAVKLVKSINDTVSKNIVSTKFHKAHYYVQWKK